MSTATLTTKGQITIPVDVRRALNVEPGDRVEFVQIEPGRFEVIAATRSVRELKGRFGKLRGDRRHALRPRAQGAFWQARSHGLHRGDERRHRGAGCANALIGLDTNVLVHYIMQDDPRQSPKATRLIESLTSEQPGFVPLVAVVELVWVLSSSYGLNKDELVEALDLLLRSKEIVVDRADLVLQAQRRFAKGGADFAD